MKWMEIAVSTSHTATEAVADIFAQLGSGGVVLEDPRVLNYYLNSGLWDHTDLQEAEDQGFTLIKAYLPQDSRLKERLKTLNEKLAQVNSIFPSGTGELFFRELQEEDWSNCWKQYFHPLRIGKKLVIKPTWEEYEKQPGDLVLEIDPGMAFGTGTHHTTSLCLETLEKVVQPGQTVFDIGTGSGILAIAAALLGAEKVLAVDFDEVAVKTAQENVVLNKLTRQIEVLQGDLLSKVSGQAELIVANIIASVISQLVYNIPQFLQPQGLFLASGIIKEREQEVLENAQKAGLFLLNKKEAGEWVMLLFKKEASNA